MPRRWIMATVMVMLGWWVLILNTFSVWCWITGPIIFEIIARGMMFMGRRSMAVMTMRTVSMVMMTMRTVSMVMVIMRMLSIMMVTMGMVSMVMVTMGMMLTGIMMLRVSTGPLSTRMTFQLEWWSVSFRRWASRFM